MCSALNVGEGGSTDNELPSRAGSVDEGAEAPAASEPSAGGPPPPPPPYARRPAWTGNPSAAHSDHPGAINAPQVKPLPLRFPDVSGSEKEETEDVKDAEHAL